MSSEIWKDVMEYEGMYQVSNFGNVKSLDRIIVMKNNTSRMVKGILLKMTKDSSGYFHVKLSKNHIIKTRTVHQLVAIAFVKHIPKGREIVVNHKDFNRQNNYADNLESVSMRDNTNQKHFKSTSEYVGVCWCKTANKWLSQISINSRSKNLGYYNTEIEAHNAYQNALNNLKNNNYEQKV